VDNITARHAGARSHNIRKNVSTLDLIERFRGKRLQRIAQCAYDLVSRQWLRPEVDGARAQFWLSCRTPSNRIHDAIRSRSVQVATEPPSTPRNAEPSRHPSALAVCSSWRA
jgi:hypothetical protein